MMTDDQVQIFAFAGIMLVFTLVGISLGILTWTNRKHRQKGTKS